MKSEQQRIAIAEVCGWQVHPKDRFIVIPPNSPNSVQPIHTIPDYLSDLNTMHEAEKFLLDKPDGVWGIYIFHLGEVTKREGLPRSHARATDRAEAFLRTLNLWTD